MDPVQRPRISHLQPTRYERVASPPVKPTCPECDASVAPQSGCVVCPQCGWSKCAA